MGGYGQQQQQGGYQQGGYQQGGYQQGGYQQQQGGGLGNLFGMFGSNNAAGGRRY